MILTTNKALGRWAEILNDEATAAALRNIDECVSHGLRKTERDEQLFRVKIILTGLIDNSELPMLLRLKVRQSLVEFSRLQCGRIAIISNANNEPPSV